MSDDPVCDSRDVTEDPGTVSGDPVCDSRDVKIQELCQVTVCAIHVTLRSRNCVR